MEMIYVRAISVDAQQAEEQEEAYWKHIPALQWLLNGGVLRPAKPVTFLVGENGAGKSTLLEAMALACGFNAEGGTRNFSFSTCDTHAALTKCLCLRRSPHRPKDGFFLRAESFYNVATEADRLDEIAPILQYYGGKSLHAQSHGESFLSLVTNRFGPQGLYFLDEPEAALSPVRQMALLAALDALVGQGSQCFIATHSPILLAYPHAEIFVLDERGMTHTPYEQTEPYVLTKAFLENPKKMLHAILEEEEQ